MTYRSISLFNAPYKTISKILTPRHRPIFMKIISEAQGAYVPRRRPWDNITVTAL